MEWHDLLVVLLTAVVVSLVWYLVVRHRKIEQRQRDELLRALDLRQQELDRLEIVAQHRTEYLSNLDHVLSAEVPSHARRTFHLEQLHLARVDVIEAYERWQDLESQVTLHDEIQLLPVAIRRHIESELLPEHVREQKVKRWQAVLAGIGVLATALTVLDSFVELTLWPFIALGVLAALVFLRGRLERVPRARLKYFSRGEGLAILILLGSVILSVCVLAFAGSVALFPQLAPDLYPEDIFLIAGFLLCLVWVCTPGVLLWSFRGRRSARQHIGGLRSQGRLEDAISLIDAHIAATPFNGQDKRMRAVLVFQLRGPQHTARLIARELEIISQRFLLFRRPDPVLYWIKDIAREGEEPEAILGLLDYLVGYINDERIRVPLSFARELDRIRSDVLSSQSPSADPTEEPQS